MKSVSSLLISDYTYKRVIESDLKHNRITRDIIGACMTVHSEPGNGFQEVIYQRCLEIEFQLHGLKNARKLEMPLYYQNYEVGRRRVDFLVEDKILLELKAVTEITTTHHAQIISYLTACKLQVGLLTNFGEPSLKFKRFIKSKFRESFTKHNP
jgi:GxxExxY protein